MANNEICALSFKESQEVLSSASSLAQRLNIGPHNPGQRGTGGTQGSPGGQSQNEDALGGHHEFCPSQNNISALFDINHSDGN